MNQKSCIVAACLVVLVVGCQSETLQSQVRPTTPGSVQPQEAFPKLIEGFLVECKKAAVNSPETMAERLGLVALRKRGQSGEDLENMDRSNWHPVLREVLERKHEKQPFEAIKRRHIDKPSLHRQEAILLLKVLGYKCAETEAIPD